MRYKTLDELAAKVLESNMAQRVMAVVEAADTHVLEAVRDALNANLASSMLFGDKQKIESCLAEIGEDPARYTIVHTTSPEESAKLAGFAIRDNKAHFIVKGLIVTGVLLKELFREEVEFRVGNHISHMNIVQVPTYHKLFALCDAAINIAPTLEQKKHILCNAVNTLTRMGIDNPKVAVIASSEAVNSKMPETVEADELKKMNQSGEIGGCIVEGPISYDLAMDKESAETKGYNSPVAGDADLLVCPNIVAANIMIKCLRYSALAQTAGIVIGGRCPVVLTSRSAAARDKYWTMVLAASATL